MSQNNIEKYFQEKFKDFEPDFPKESWQNISNQIKSKKTKKNYIWYKFSGLIAMLFLGFFTFNSLKDINKIPDKNEIENSVVIDENNKTLNSTKNNKENDTNISKNNKTNPTDLNNLNIIKEENKSRKESFTRIQKNNINTNVLINSNKTNNLKLIKIDSFSKNSNANINKNNDDLIANNSISNKKSIIKIDYVENKLESNNQIEKTFNSNEEINSSSLKDTTKNNNLSFNTTISDNIYNEKLKNEINIDTSNVVIKTFKIELASNIDSSKVLNLKERNVVKNRWEISTLVAPIFINSIKNNSTISNNLNENDKKYYQSLSYGAYIQYQFTSKIGVRLGVSHINSLQETNNVAFTTEVDLKNNIFKQNSIHFLNTNSKDNQELFSRKVNEGTIKQEINFIEIPLELNYSLIDKKIKINVLGGASLLILNGDNSYIKTNQNQFINLGNASNINSINYSLNFGFGASYPIFSQMRFHLQPSVRYHINTFSENNNNPYYLGIFSGLSFKF